MEENSQNLPAPVSEGKGSAIASLVLGICSIAVGIIPFLGLIPRNRTILIVFLPFVTLILAIVGVALAHDAGKRGYQGGIWTAGRVVSIIWLIFSAVFVVLVCALSIFAVHTFVKAGDNAGIFLSSFLSSFFSSMLYGPF